MTTKTRRPNFKRAPAGNNKSHVVGVRLANDVYDEVGVAVKLHGKAEGTPTLTEFMRKAVDLYLQELRDAFNEGKVIA